MGVEEFLLGAVASLLANLIYQGTGLDSLAFFQKRKIKSRIDDAIAEAVEPLLPFLQAEKISEDKQKRLIETCVAELTPLIDDPQKFFQASLDGQKIFDQLYAKRDFPQVITEDGLKDIYALLCPRIATLLCKIPSSVKDWENESWSENYRRLDDIATQLGKVFLSIDKISALPEKQSDELLARARKMLTQKIRLSMDLTGLRADKPSEGDFDSFFVHPDICLLVNKEKNTPTCVNNASFEKFIRNSHQNIIRAPAGAGKSTWTKWLQREALTAQYSGIVVRIELRRLAGEELPSIHSLVRNVLGKHLEEEATAERINVWLKSKQVIFILDGFDEIAPNSRDNVFNWIIDLKSAAYFCSFVLTSRPLTTNHLERFNDEWYLWEIQPFNRERIHDYIRRWYKFTPLLEDAQREIDIQGLAGNWLSDPTIEPLTGNPLLLSTLLMVHHLDGCLPNGRAQLYQRYVQGMLGLWDERRNIIAEVSLSLLQKQQLLRGFSIKMFFDERDQLDEPDVLSWLGEYLDKTNLNVSAEAILIVLRERTGLITGPGVYSFTHKTLSEYLVAEAIYQGDQRDAEGNRIDRLRLLEHKNDDRWNVVIFLWAGLAPSRDIESFIKQCIEVKNWSLAYGLLYDQYNRIPKDSCRKFLLKSLTLDNCFKAENHFFIGSNYRNQKNNEGIFTIPNFTLRGVTHNLSTELFQRAIADKVLTCADAITAKPLQKNLLWMLLITKPHLQDWEKCLTLPTPKISEQLHWACWAFEFITIYLLRVSPDLFIEKMNQFDRAYPFIGRTKAIMMLSIFSTDLSDISINGEPSSLSIEGWILKFIPLSVTGELSDDILLQTSDWHFGLNFRQKEHGDLFEVFYEKLEKLIEANEIPKDDTYKNALTVVQELQTQRAKLQR